MTWIVFQTIKNEAISFDGYLGRSAVAVNGTRGSVLDKDALQKSEEGFGVFGNYSEKTETAYGDNLFKNQSVTYNKAESKWKYTPLKYWSTEGHIDFLAYAPYDKNTTLTDSKINFTVADQVGNQKDLLWANVRGQTKTDKPVTFTFNHALAKIGYAVKKGVTDDNVTITLNKITLAGSANENPAKGAFYTTGNINLSKDLTNTEDKTDLWTGCNGEQYFTWFTGFPNVTNSLLAGSDYLFVIPQDFSTGTKKLYVIVDYTISYKGGPTAEMKSTVSSPIVMNFLQGKAYTINLTIGLTPIDFAVDVVKGWENGATIPDITWN